MKQLTLGLALLLSAAPFTARAVVPPGWSTNATVLDDASFKPSRPVLVLFSASWCGPCKVMARTTLEDTNVLAALKRFVPVALDVDQHPALARRFNISAVPTFLVLQSGGGEVARASGYQDAAVFLRWLDQAETSWREASRRAEITRQALKQVDDALQSGRPERLQEAVRVLCDLCAARDDAEAEAALTRLKPLVQTHPELLLEGLNHPRLATRLRIANLLREQFGPSFDVDPWADAATRQKAITTCRQRLAPPRSHMGTP